MPRLDRKSTCDKLMVQRLQTLLRVIFLMAKVKGARIQNAETHVVAKGHHAAIDLVEREPVATLALEMLHDGLGILHVAVNSLARSPAIDFLAHGKRHLVMTQRHERFDAVLMALVHHAIVKRKASRVGLIFESRWEDARPVHRETKDLESHLGEQGDVLFVVMVEIDTIVTGIELVGVELGRDLARVVMVAVSGHIHATRTLAVYVPGSLELIGSSRAAPKKVFWKNTHGRPLFYRKRAVIATALTLVE